MSERELPGDDKGAAMRFAGYSAMRPRGESRELSLRAFLGRALTREKQLALDLKLAKLDIAWASTQLDKEGAK